MYQLINENVKVNPESRKGLRWLVRSKPWQGDFAERCDKFASALTMICAGYGLNPTFDFRGPEKPKEIGNGCWDRRRSRITLVGKLSVVTLLHCIARARGFSQAEAVRWSISVFKRFFPISFGRCRMNGFLLVR